MEKYKMYIGGKFEDAVSGKTFPAVNPATEEKFAEVPLGGKEDVDKAVQPPVKLCRSGWGNPRRNKAKCCLKSPKR